VLFLTAERADRPLQACRGNPYKHVRENLTKESGYSLTDKNKRLCYGNRRCLEKWFMLAHEHENE